ncbi:short chain enoyl-CoA hydratase [Jatrophihabitans endophyticus]|uniref:Short chain enoyl-CoA hydratase n=1 Tax=Jatrophihabitans endophyticus TaxID=1206085 RepID=A0A1M5PWW1_9ACTN|nr:crotonase/enoyl-CoA hydratase family protein [Jatrophihabitans endophyticus]SHH06021.1 short chain enoyl-CoA hydratase [Jatrophihabitans endophyticus]
MSSVRTAVDGAVLTVTIDRPAARNAIDAATALALADAFATLDRRDDLRAAVLTGAGGNFSAGMDLKAFLRGESPVVDDRGFGGLCTRPPAKPLVAAVEGWALAGGCELALACDIVVAGRTARFGLPEVRRGLLATAGGTARLPRRVPLGAAMLLALTGEPVVADEAHRLGLVDRLADGGDALTTAQAIARTIAANAPLSVVAGKAAVLAAHDTTLAEALAAAAHDAEHIAASDDAREGATAFAEKRAPRWTGR